MSWAAADEVPGARCNRGKYSRLPARCGRMFTVKQLSELSLDPCIQAQEEWRHCSCLTNLAR